MYVHAVTRQPDGTYRVYLTERHCGVYVDVTPDGEYIDGALTPASKTGRLAFILTCKAIRTHFV